MGAEGLADSIQDGVTGSFDRLLAADGIAQCVVSDVEQQLVGSCIVWDLQL